MEGDHSNIMDSCLNLKSLNVISKAHQNLMYLIAESLNLGLIVRDSEQKSSKLRISLSRKKKNKSGEKYPVVKACRTLGRGRKRRKFTFYLHNLLNVIKLCLKLSISIRISFLRLGLPRNMSRIGNDYPFTSQYYETELSESDPSDTAVSHHFVPKPIPRPISSFNVSQRTSSRPPSRQKVRPSSHVPYGSRIPVTSPIRSDVQEIFRRGSIRQTSENYCQPNYENLDRYFFKSCPNHIKKPHYTIPFPAPQNYPIRSGHISHEMQENQFIKESADNYQAACRQLLQVSRSKSSATKIPSGTGLNATKANPKRLNHPTKPERLFKKTTPSTKSCKKETYHDNTVSSPTDHWKNNGSDREKKSLGDHQTSFPQKSPLERHHSLPVYQDEKSVGPNVVSKENNSNNTIESVLKRYEDIVHNFDDNKRNKMYEHIKEKKSKGIHTFSYVTTEQTNLDNEHKIRKDFKELKTGDILPPKNLTLHSSKQINLQEDNATEVLQTMLHELMQKGCVNKLPQTLSAEQEKNEQNSYKTVQIEEDACKSIPNIFVGDKTENDENIIAENSKTDNHQNMQENKQTSSSFKLEDRISNPSFSKEIQVPSTPDLMEKIPFNIPRASRPLTCASKTNRNDYNYSMELHRSKSYIVNLIDRALSKELGTTPDERVNYCGAVTKEDFNNDPKIFLQMIQKQQKPDVDGKDLTLDLSNSLSDSRISNSNTQQLNSKEGCNCPCPVSQREEPPYIKQLKQLRWGHLKHIQREVKRLADLEKFLDSCYSTNEFI